MIFSFLHTPMPVLRSRSTPIILFVAAMTPLAAYYIVFWAGLGMSMHHPSILLALLISAGLTVVLMLVAAAVTCESTARWLSIGLAGTVILMSSASTYFSLALAPLGIVIVVVSIVRLISKHKSAFSASRIGSRPSSTRAPTALVGAASILLGIAAPVWASIAAPNVLVVWAVIGLSAVFAGVMLTLSAAAREA